MENRHSPTPWHEGDTAANKLALFSQQEGGVAIVEVITFPLRKNGKANAAFIKRAVNTHDDAQRAIAYLVCDGIVNADKYYPPEIATWARDLMLNEKRTGMELIKAATGIKFI